MLAQASFHRIVMCPKLPVCKTILVCFTSLCKALKCMQFGLTDSQCRLKPCSHSTLIMIHGSIIQAIILHSILFNYGSVHICENSNTIR